MDVSLGGCWVVAGAGQRWGVAPACPVTAESPTEWMGEMTNGTGGEGAASKNHTVGLSAPECTAEME